MIDPSQPLHMNRREGFCLHLASGAGPSAAYSAAGYTFKSREHLSKNASSQAAKSDVAARTAWLKERPRLAVDLLQAWVATQCAAEAAERGAGLRDAVKARQVARADKAIPRAADSLVAGDDVEPILSLLEYCRDEARAIYTKSSEQRSDAYIVKASLAAHRDFTVQLEAVRDLAKQADSAPVSAINTDSTVAQIMHNIRAELELTQTPTHYHDIPAFKSETAIEVDTDIENLRFNVAATLKEYDSLCARSAVNQRDRLALITVLQVSLVRLAKMLSAKLQSEKHTDRPAPVGGPTIDIDLVSQFFEHIGLTDYLDKIRIRATQNAQNNAPTY